MHIYAYDRPSALKVGQLFFFEEMFFRTDFLFWTDFPRACFARYAWGGLA